MTAINPTTQQEEWRDVPGYAGLYKISESGQIVSLQHLDTIGRLRKERKLKPTANQDGYYRIVLTNNGIKTRYSVHYLVLLTFVGRRPHGLDINHKDGDRANNHISNLEYCTTSHNVNDGKLRKYRARTLARNNPTS